MADVKPDNILVNWTCDKDGKITVTNVALGDFDIAFRSEGGKARQTPYPIGNAMWRSPEGQTGRGVTKASDIFSFGLVVSDWSHVFKFREFNAKPCLQCIYALGGAEAVLLDGSSYQELVEHGISPEQEIVTRHFCYFGPVPEGLLQRVDDEDWCNALKEASEVAERAVKELPDQRFARWGQELGPGAQDMISGMTNLDPTARLTMDQVLMHPWWREAD